MIKAATIGITIIKVVQVFSLCALFLSIIMIWTVEASLALDLSLAQQTSTAFSQQTNDFIASLRQVAPDAARIWILISGILTAMLFCIKSFRAKHSHHLTISIGILLFCVVAGASAPSYIRSVLAGI